MSPENKATLSKFIGCTGDLSDFDLLAEEVETIMNAVRAEERARADTITPAMIQAAKDRVQGPDEDMYSAIYRAIRAAAYITDSEGGA